MSLCGDRIPVASCRPAALGERERERERRLTYLLIGVTGCSEMRGSQIMLEFWG